MSMEKHVLLHNDGKFFIIVHAAPNQVGSFQWYWTDDLNDGPEIDIKGQTHESITLSSEEIKKHYFGKWLACHCDVEGNRYNEGCVYLTDHFAELIRSNQFESISFFDDDGNIRADVSYEKKRNPPSQ